MASGKAFYDRIFGSGPLIAAASGMCLGAAWLLEQATPEFGWSIPGGTRLSIMAGSVALCIAIIAWSVRTLRPERRGTELVTDGPFRYVRHPLYAACLTILGPGLVFALAHPAYILALVGAHLAAHGLIGREERLMADWFPQQYTAYCARTRRFIPLPATGRSAPSGPVA
jgi:protein-S-isoprenylcysteine O-methyltransferase Ste14